MENLEEMRAQFEALNRKLEKQNIINERMMQEVMKRRVSPAKRTYIIAICAGLYMFSFGLWSLHEIGFSTLFISATLALIAASLCATIYIGGDVLTGRLFDRPMLEIAERAAEKIRLTRQWKKIAIPILILWLIWMFCDRWQEGNEFIFCGLVVGLIIGGFLGWRSDNKSIKSYQALIRDIEEFTKDD